MQQVVLKTKHSKTKTEALSTRISKTKPCGHTTDFYLGKTDLPKANPSKIVRGKFISGFILPR